MRKTLPFIAGSLAVVVAVLAPFDHAIGAEVPTAKFALSFRPVQKDVEYETPPADQVEQCQVKVERTGKGTGWVVLGPAGQPLRRFVDTNGDTVVDQWRYYNQGLEVYRDLDMNFNNKVDQSRWVNSGGTRWGIDSNEDGRIDSWKMLSAEEASREAILATGAGDAAALEILFLTAEDIRTLGIDPELGEKVLEQTKDVRKKLPAVLSASKSLGPQSRWLRFDAMSPSLIPAEEGKSKSDLFVYENAMAIIELQGKSSLVQIGELVRVGDVWKLTQIPQPLEGDRIQITAGGILMQPTALALGTSDAPSAPSPEMLKVLEELQKLDTASPPASERAALARYYGKRTELLEKLVGLSQNDAEREQWTRQLIDGITAAVQVGIDSDGLKRLQALEAQVRRMPSKDELLPFLAYRKLLAEYNLRLQQAEPDKRGDVQKWWSESLQTFVKENPKAEDAPEAMLHLATAEEFGGRHTDALDWYHRLAKEHASSPEGAKAKGAIQRLELNGKPLALAGPGLAGGTIDVRSLRGKVVLVLFWATWCQPCIEDLPQLRALYQQYHSQGFEIVGVNLDSSKELIAPYLKQYNVTWPQIFQEGALESELAQSYGIISLPTMFLVGKDGKVISRNITAADLKAGLPELLKAQQAASK